MGLTGIVNAEGSSITKVFGDGAELRALCSVRKATFYARLEDLTRAGRLLRSPEGYHLAATA